MKKSFRPLSRACLYMVLFQAFMFVVVSVNAQPTFPCPTPVCIPIVVTRLVIPSPAVKTLKTPAFSPQQGTYPYGSVVGFVADSLAPGDVVEYSMDNGTTWTVGKQFTVLGDNEVLARIRNAGQISKTIRALFNVSFQRMVVIGNSITNHGPDITIGWLNNNGMAASAPDSDFVHRLQKKLIGRSSQAQAFILDGIPFETLFWSYDFNFRLTLPVQNYNPDLIIVRISENIDENQVSSRGNGSVFRANYDQLLEKLIQLAPSAKIICTTSFWSNPTSSQIIREVAVQRGVLLADISKEIYSRPDYATLLASQYADKGVAKHPNDKGMAAIANLIWLEILR